MWATPHALYNAVNHPHGPMTGDGVKMCVYTTKLFGDFADDL